jgi:hypothetical protein
LDRSGVRPPARIVALVAGALLLTMAPGEARADTAADLEKARTAYLAHKYDDAEARLRPLLDTLLDAKAAGHDDPDSIADARMYLGAVLLAESKRDDANATFEKLLLEKPDYKPDPLRVSLEAINAFIDTRTRLNDKLTAITAERIRLAEAERANALLARKKAELRLAMLEKAASEEVVAQKNSRWVALLPFGAGQFQNGQTSLGYTFLSGEALLGAGSIVGAALMFYNSGQTQAAVHRGDGTAPAYNARAQEAAWAGDIFGGAFLLAAVVGIVHAELTFLPEKVTVRKRELPPVTLLPYVGPGGIGIQGMF